MHEDLIGPLLRRDLGVEAVAIRPLTGGEVGRVFRVDAGGGSYAVKFVQASREPPFSDEPVDDRVYGSRWSNLVPAHALLRENGVGVPALHAHGTLVDEGLNYAILDYLDGDPDDGSPAWSACVGRVLGRMHSLVRPYHGWVGMQPVDAVHWPSAFARSFEGWRARAKAQLSPPLLDAVARRCQPLLAALREPEQFVFSHTDGFQGVLKRTVDWSLLGVIDLEDHQFTDQRFVLAGFELSRAFYGPFDPVFWDAYAALKPVDPSYPAFKPLFQTYYLLVWTWVFRDRPSQLEPAVQQLERVVGRA
jgi:fructosamine-3-kinase